MGFLGMDIIAWRLGGLVSPVLSFRRRGDGTMSDLRVDDVEHMNI